MTASPKDMMMQAYARAAAKTEGQSANGFVDAVQRERPDLRGQMTYTPEYGISSNVFFTAGEYFKAPKKVDDPEKASAIRAECRITRHLSERGLPVPSVTCEGQQSVFFGMERLPGVPLLSQKEMSDEDLTNVAKQVAGFAADMAQTFTPGEIDTFGIERRGLQSGALQEALKNPKVRAGLGTSLAGCGRLAEAYDRIFSEKSPAVLHLDMNKGNILIDPATKKVTGVLDFGLIVCGIPEACRDFKLWVYSKEFQEAFCNECTAQGMPINPRHQFLDDFAFRLQRFHKSIRAGNMPSYGPKLFGNFIEQLDELTRSTGLSKKNALASQKRI